MRRIAHLDGLRGLAIILVLLFHAFYRWEINEPWNIDHEIRHIFSYGWLGVELFFMISGFVIYLTLDASVGVKDFLLRRWLRLFPAMVMGSIFIYLTASYIPNRPLGVPSGLDVIPGVLFLDPSLVKFFVGKTVNSLDGAFWSIYIEVKFYLIAGFSYFLLRDKVGGGVLIIYLVYMVDRHLFALFGFSLGNNVVNVLNLLGASFYGWFLVGIFFYRFKNSGAFGYFCISLFLAFLALWDLYCDRDRVAVFIMFFILFAFCGAFYIKLLSSIFSSGVLRFAGYISYPLYLIHQNFVTGFSIEVFKFEPRLDSWFYPVFAIVVAVFVSYLIAKAEPFMRKILALKLSVG